MADSRGKFANSPNINLSINRQDRKINLTFCKTNRIICCLIYSTTGTINYNYVKCSWVEMETPLPQALAMPSCSFQFAAVCAGCARGIIKRRLWGICWHCWHSAFLLMKTWQTDRQGLAQCLRVAAFATAFPLTLTFCLHLQRLLLPSPPKLTLATLINVIGHMQIFGALAGLLLGITNGARKTALQSILALVAKLFLSSTGIICKEQERESVRESKTSVALTHVPQPNPQRQIYNETATNFQSA